MPLDAQCKSVSTVYMECFQQAIIRDNNSSVGTPLAGTIQGNPPGTMFYCDDVFLPHHMKGMGIQHASVGGHRDDGSSRHKRPQGPLPHGISAGDVPAQLGYVREANLYTARIGNTVTPGTAISNTRSSGNSRSFHGFLNKSVKRSVLPVTVLRPTS